MPKPLSKIRESNRTEFVSGRTKALDSMFDNKYADGIYPTSILFEKLDKLTSTSESHIIEGIKEWAKGKKIKVPSIFGGAAMTSKKCVVCGIDCLMENTASIGLCEKDRLQMVGHAINAALSDLLAFLDEGLTGNK